MGEFGLQDLYTILGALLALGVCIVAGAAVIVYGPRLGRALALMLDAQNERRPLVRFVRDMSSVEGEEMVRFEREPVEPLPVLAGTDAERTSSESEREPVREPLTLQNRDELIAHLAQLKDASGKYCLSANAIVAAVGGTAADVKSKVAAERGTRPAPVVHPKGVRLARPESGW